MTRSGWSVARLTLAFYPFGAGAMAINLFFASLILSWSGWRVLSPTEALIGGAAIGLPASWAFARHIRRLMDRADGT